MKTKLLLLFFLIQTLFSFSQGFLENTYQGYVQNESRALENIHVINKTKNKVTLTDAEGYFRIPCELGDEISFTSVNFNNLEITIDDSFQRQQVYFIELENTIELEEVELRNHGLSGTLSFDSEKVPESDYAKMNAEAVHFVMPVDLGYSLDEDRVKAPIVSLLPGQNFGGDMFAAVGLVLSPIFLLTEPSDLRKRVKSKELQRLREYEELLKTLPKVLVKEYGRTLFVERLDIPEHKIESFIKYCYKDAIISLYQDEKHLEIMEVFLKNKKSFEK